jgi:hypothetical protein
MLVHDCAMRIREQPALRAATPDRKGAVPMPTMKSSPIIEFIATPAARKSPATVRSGPHSGHDPDNYLLSYWLACPACGSEVYSQTPILSCPSCHRPA